MKSGVFTALPLRGVAGVAAALALVTALIGGWRLFLGKDHSPSTQQNAQVVRRVPTIQPGKEIHQPSTAGSINVEHDATRSTRQADNTNIAVLDTSREPALTFTLQPGAVRGAGSVQNKLVLPSNITSVIFHLPVPYDSYAKYSVELRTAEGKSVQTSNRVTSRQSDGQAVVSFRVPSRRLTPGDYFVLVSGTDALGKSEEIQAYGFRIFAR